MTEHIQIGAVAPRIQYMADGVQTAFTYPFPIMKAEALEVYIGDILQGSGFVVTGASASSGGSVTFTTAPTAGGIVTLRRQVVIERTSDFQEGGQFRAKVINDELDTQTMALQQLADDLALAVRRSPTVVGTVDLTLPEPVANRGLKWNATASGLDTTASDLDAIASAAATSATNAANSATAASTSATNAANSATAAGTSATSAESSAVSVGARLVSTSTTSMTIGTGGQSLTVQTAEG